MISVTELENIVPHSLCYTQCSYSIPIPTSGCTVPILCSNYLINMFLFINFFYEVKILSNYLINICSWRPNLFQAVVMALFDISFMVFCACTFSVVTKALRYGNSRRLLLFFASFPRFISTHLTQFSNPRQKG